MASALLFPPKEKEEYTRDDIYVLSALDSHILVNE